MRFIDDKGKILGVINVFDLLVIILILVMIVPGAVFRKKYYEKRQGFEGPYPYKHVYKTVRARGYIIPEVANLINAGDSKRNPNGEIVFEVIKVIYNKPVFYGNPGGTTLYRVSSPLPCPRDGEEKDTSFREIEIEMRLLCKVERTGAITIGVDTPLSLGVSTNLDTEEYFVPFQITEIK